MSSFPNHVHGLARVELGRKWGKASAAKRTGEPDWPTICKRGADACRGQILREGVTYKFTGEVAWSIARSVQGRINQLDVIVNGSVWATAGARRLRAKGIQI